VFTVQGGQDAAVLDALKTLMAEISKSGANLDFLSITLTAR